MKKITGIIKLEIDNSDISNNNHNNDRMSFADSIVIEEINAGPEQKIKYFFIFLLCIFSCSLLGGQNLY